MHMNVHDTHVFVYVFDLAYADSLRSFNNENRYKVQIQERDKNNNGYLSSTNGSIVKVPILINQQNASHPFGKFTKYIGKYLHSLFGNSFAVLFGRMKKAG